MPQLAEGLAYFVVFLMSTTLHEAAHAWAAMRGGDLTAYNGGQVTLDPRRHMKREPFGMVVLPLLTAVTLAAVMLTMAAFKVVTRRRTCPRREAPGKTRTRRESAGKTPTRRGAAGRTRALRMRALGAFPSPMTGSFPRGGCRHRMRIWTGCCITL